MIEKRNSIANYAGLVITTSIILVVSPIYLNLLGAESYGLIGFFAMISTWLGLVDLGMSPTLSREISISKAKKNFIDFRKLLRSFELIFLIISIIFICISFFVSKIIATDWTTLNTLSISTVNTCLIYMSLIVAIRWFASLYRSGVIGLEDQVWLNMLNISINSLSYFGYLFILIFYSTDIVIFFQFQLLFSLTSLAFISRRLYSKISTKKEFNFLYFDTKQVLRVLPFASGIAYTTFLWIIVSEIDKLIFSYTLTLEDYGIFMILMILTSGISLLSSPITKALLPRMTYLKSKNEISKFLMLYLKNTRNVAFITFSVAITFSIYSEELVMAWTGNIEAAKMANDVLIWYAIGNCLISINGMQYLIQVAHGNLRLHITSTTLSAILQAPLIIYFAINYGLIEASKCWFAFRLLWFFIYIPIVHNKFHKEILIRWYLVVFYVFSVVTFFSFIFHKLNLMELFSVFMPQFFALLSLGLLLLLLCFATHQFFKKLI